MLIDLKSSCVAGKSIMLVKKIFGSTRFISQSSASRCDGKLPERNILIKDNALSDNLRTRDGLAIYGR